MTRKPKQNGRDYGAEVLAGAINELSGGVNLEAGTNAVNSALEALQKQAKALAQAMERRLTRTREAGSRMRQSRRLGSISSASRVR